MCVTRFRRLLSYEIVDSCWRARRRNHLPYKSFATHHVPVLRARHGQASIRYGVWYAPYMLSSFLAQIHRQPPMLPLLPQSPTSTSHSRSPTFRGHRRNSYMPVDRAELVEFRARQRTFDNAYLRTSLSNLTSSVVIFKLFDPRFYKSGSRCSPSKKYKLEQQADGAGHSRLSLCHPGSYSSGYFLCTSILLERGLCRSCRPSKRATIHIWNI